MVRKGNGPDQAQLTQIAKLTTVSAISNCLLLHVLILLSIMARIYVNELEPWALIQDGENVRYAMRNDAFSELEQSYKEPAEPEGRPDVGENEENVKRILAPWKI